nr:uncharacterized mitochondrial protein AtMg00810-like [Tanacetum cinerariifolium]
TKSASTPIDTKKPLLKDHDGEDVNMHTYGSMIGSLMYLTSSRPDIMFAVYACTRFQVTPKASHLHAVKRIFGYLKGKPHLGLWDPKDSPFDLVAYSDSDYAEEIVFTEATIWEALRLDDEEGIECLPNEEIFAELARMGYEKPSTKLTFDKAFLSSHWKFLIHTILQCMSARRTSWNEFSSSMASAVICLSLEQQDVEEGDANGNDKTVNAGDVSISYTTYSTTTTISRYPFNFPSTTNTTTITLDHLEFDKVAQALEFTKLKRRVKKLDRRNKDDKEVTDEAKEVADVVKDVEEMKPLLLNITAAEAQVPSVTLTATPARVTAAPSRRRKGVVIRDPKEESTISTIIPAETKSKDKAIDNVKRMAKEDPAVKSYQVLKRKPQTEAQASKNMMVYLKNVAGFKMDYFKGMSYDDIRPIFERYFDSNVAFLQKTKEQIEEEESRALKRINETPPEKAAKRQKLAKVLINSV